MWFPAVVFKLYLPSMSVVVFSFVPLINTLANGNVSLLESLSVSTPEIVPLFCA